MTDSELLHQFAQTGDAEAFTELVRRHVDVVYTAARRQAGGDAHLAEDITQRVFILLSQKATSLGDEVLLGGWLFNSVRFVARNELRQVQRRTTQETKAAAMAEEIRKASTPAKPASWDDAESVLDDAMAKLDQQTRGVLVLRYFEGKTAREVGDRLGISEEAARKRVSRAVDQLRGIFARRGVALSAADIATGLALPTAHAPAHIAAAATLAATSSAAATASTSTTFVKGVFAMMAYAKTQTAALAIVGLILVGGAVVGGVKVIRAISTPTAHTITLPPAPPPTGPTMSGIVRGLDGKPIAGAKVWLATEKTLMYLPALPKSKRLAQTPVTDADGKYTVAKPEPPFAIFIVTDDAFAQASWEQLKLDTNLTLKPLSRIEGTTNVADKVAPRGNVDIWRVQQHDDPWSHLMHVEANTNADANGHFVFAGVPPGEYWVFTRPRANNAGSRQWQYVQVEPGKTASVTLGGAGVRVTGHVDVPAAIAHFVDWMNNGPHSYMATIVRTDIPRDRPKHAPGETPEQFTAVELAFGKTDAGKATNTAMFDSSFSIRPDGTFTIDDVVPGKYKINIRNLEDQKGTNFSEDVAGAEKEVIIGTTPFDIGGVMLKAVEHHARPGQTAPDFSVTTIDGKAWKLADQKGKTVVLFFWATDRQNMGEETFGAFADRWSGNANVSILGVCLPDDEKDKENKLIKTIAAKLNFHFPQCSDGDRLMTLYDSSWPDAVLIDKQGQIVRKNLMGDLLEKAMKKQMAN